MDELIPLSDAALARLPRSIARPVYDRKALRPGIVHIGVGNFHRAHQAWYLHRLMQAGEAMDWAIIGAGIRAYDAEMREKLLAQDCLTTLIELAPDGSRAAEIVGAMIDYLPVEDSNAALVARMADPAIRIVALTVTEGGYFIDPASKEFDAGHADIRHDVAYPDRPRTAFGAMVAALRLRRDAGLAPFTGMSCDNLMGNGQVLRKVVVSLARMTDPELADWIDSEGAFPNSMVDCIVPATGDNERALARSLGIDDAVPVTHEDFRQWVIEDRFCAGRPDWDKAGAVFSDRVHDYEVMKLRILNAGHQILANAGEVLSVDTISQCMAHPLIRDFFHKVERDEIVPHVAAVPDMAPAQYVDLIARRFANPAIVDTTRRVAFDGSSRHPGFVLPILHDALKHPGRFDGLALAEAFWARMCFGTREDGSAIAHNDPVWDSLTATARAARSRPHVWLEQRQIYGDLADNAAFSARFAHWLALIWSDGAEAALAAYARP
ncbi:MAG: mannitol dehydrogenase family protein [Marinibacterium sp.]